jgi:hypothetical protein
VGVGVGLGVVGVGADFDNAGGSLTVVVCDQVNLGDSR